jgi:hypothetical protein
MIDVAPPVEFHNRLDAFNTGDRSRIAAFPANTFPSRDVEREMAFRAQAGSIKIRALQEVS